MRHLTPWAFAHIITLVVCVAWLPSRPVVGQQTAPSKPMESLEAEDVSHATTDWLRWRGPHDNGSIAGTCFPSALDPEKALWKAELTGKGCSTPITVEGKIYLTAPDGDKDSLVCFDSTGKQRLANRMQASIATDPAATLHQPVTAPPFTCTSKAEP